MPQHARAATERLDRRLALVQVVARIETQRRRYRRMILAAALAFILLVPPLAYASEDCDFECRRQAEATAREIDRQTEQLERIESDRAYREQDRERDRANQQERIARDQAYRKQELERDRARQAEQLEREQQNFEWPSRVLEPRREWNWPR